jgi:hypothetical protein
MDLKTHQSRLLGVLHDANERTLLVLGAEFMHGPFSREAYEADFDRLAIVGNMIVECARVAPQIPGLIIEKMKETRHDT